MKQGIDVSKWQVAINWPEVKLDGVQFAIIRAGIGNTAKQKDPYFEANYKNAKAAGIELGAYWYSYAQSVAEAVQEAKACIECLKGKQFEYPIYFDVEDKVWYNVEDRKTKTEMCKAFCTTLENAGYFTGVYSFTAFFNAHLDVKELAKLYTIWLADWRGNYDKTIPRDMHQFSNSGTVDGITGRVDLDKCTRDFPSIIKNAGLNGYKKPDDKLYNIAILGASKGDADTICNLCDNLKLIYKKEAE